MVCYCPANYTFTAYDWNLAAYKEADFGTFDIGLVCASMVVNKSLLLCSNVGCNYSITGTTVSASTPALTFSASTSFILSATCEEFAVRWNGPSHTGGPNVGMRVTLVGCRPTPIIMHFTGVYGDPISITPSGYDYGTVTAPISQNFSIINLSTQTIPLVLVAVSGDTSLLTYNSTPSVPGNSSLTTPITITPNGTSGDKSATLRLSGLCTNTLIHLSADFIVAGSVFTTGYCANPCT